MKKVLFIIPSFQRGGMENMLINVANIISKRANVTIYNLGSDDLSMVKRLSANISYYPCWQPCKNIFHCGIKNFLKGNFRLLPAKYWYRFHSGDYIHRHMVSEAFDVEVAFFVGEPVRIVSGCPKYATRRIAWIHSDYSMSDGLFQCFSDNESAITAYKTFDEIVCVSKNAKKAFKKVVGNDDNCKIIYNYLPVDEIKKLSREKIWVKKNGSVQMVVVGRLVKAKGIDRLLKALNQLNKEQCSVGLWIVGDGAERKELELYVKRNNLNNVLFCGMQNNPYPYIANADFLVCSSRYEGYNLTVAEAIVLGTPVLSTECTGPTEILDNGKYGMLVHNSEDGLYAGLKFIADNPACLEKFRIATEQRAEFFSEEKLRQQLYACILN